MNEDPTDFSLLLQSLNEDQFTDLMNVANTMLSDPNARTDPATPISLDEALTGDHEGDGSSARFDVVSVDPQNRPDDAIVFWSSRMTTNEDGQTDGLSFKAGWDSAWGNMQEFVFYDGDRAENNITIDIDGSTAGEVATQLEDGLRAENITVDDVDYDNVENKINISFATASTEDGSFG